MSLPDGKAKGPLAWMVYNRVTPNLLMLVLLFGGWFFASTIKKEVFPEFEMDAVTVSVPFPGASPEEVEQGVILAIEEAVSGLEGIQEITSSASENSAILVIELMSGVNRQKVYQDIQQQVARINTFPEDAEEPQVTLNSRRRDVMEIQLYGDVDEWALRSAAEQVRESLLQSSDITQIDLEGVRDYEIHIEVSEANLRAYSLTLNDIAKTIGDSAIDRSGGKVETDGGEILLRVRERKDWATEFANIPVITSANGALLRLGDIATVREGFADSNTYATLNGLPAIGLKIYRVGEETPNAISAAALSILPDAVASLPSDIKYFIADDDSEIYQQRLQLLLRNGFVGLILVFALLSLFLELKLAFWVAVGIPTSFLGAFLFLPWFGVSINMVSMFAFIIALGIVVDDAIVAGENIYEYRQRGYSFMEAAVKGAQDIAVPVTFSILTNIVAFMPLMFIPGGFGKIWAVIPAVVATVFVISWVEALLVLPSHVGHIKERPRGRIASQIHGWQQAFSSAFVSAVKRYYAPFILRAVAHRYLTLALAIGLLAIVMAYPLSGRMGFILMPKVESDYAAVTAVYPVGSAKEKLEAGLQQLVSGAKTVFENNGGEMLGTGIFAVVKDNTIDIRAYLTPSDVRPISTSKVAGLWREAAGVFPDAEYVRFESNRGGPGRGAAITVELSHSDIALLDRASTELAELLGEIGHVKDIDDGYTKGKRQWDIELTEEARAMQLTARDVGSQIRNAFYGAEALRQQRGRNEVKVLVRLPEQERSHIYDIENLLLSTPAGGAIPLMQAAFVKEGNAFTKIDRRSGRRTVTVTANVEPLSESNQVLSLLKTEVLPQLVRDYPGLNFSFEGRQAEMRDAMMSFLSSVTVALLVMYILLAIPFRSYSQPAIVMFAIPFGLVGAVIGHLIMGYNMSIISVMGVIALAGVVVNDSLVMIDYANARLKEGATPVDAIVQAGVRRFRPILLTTLTTFGGLAPMIFETSRQARFMIPMAVSLGYGILFATAIMLVLIPCLFMINEDLRQRFRFDDGSHAVT